MKNQNKANACRTQIADISVAGKELSEEHLRLASGGIFRSGDPGPSEPVPITTCHWKFVCVDYIYGSARFPICGPKWVCEDDTTRSLG